MFLKRLINIVKYSFFSKEFYIDLFHNLKGLKLQYIAALLFIANLSFVIPSYIFTEKAVKNNALLKDFNFNYILSQLPKEIVIKNNILELPDDTPEIIYSKEKRPVIGFVIKNNLKQLQEKEIPIILGKTGTYIFTDDNYFFIDFNLHLPSNSSISPQIIIDQIQLLKNNLGWIFFIFYFISTVIKGVSIGFNALFFAIFGFLYLKIRKHPIVFLPVYRTAIFASFPSIIIESVFNMYISLAHNSIINFQNAIHSNFKSNIIFFIFAGYFYYALFHIAKSIKSKMFIK